MPTISSHPSMQRLLGGFAVVSLLAVLAPDAAPAQAATAIGPDARYAGIARRLEALIAAEMSGKKLPALSIAIVVGDRTVWARGFGYERVRDSVPATASTVYRVGSVSKLFTDIGIMQLVERGEVDLDAPVTRYLPDFAPRNEYGKAITLRQLMSHRSGLVREPPVGHYFDDTAPSLAATVASLNTTSLVYAPETRTKYSNAAIATVGRVLEKVSGRPFAQYLEASVLRPMGLRASSFEPKPELVRRLANAEMWTLHGRSFEAPSFQLGMAPAGSMYAPVTDLARFMTVLFARGLGPAGPVLRPATLDTMWTPQYAPRGARSGFGIGFAIGELGGARVVRHGGAIYGFATELVAMPDEKLGVVVAIARDGANVVASRIATAALNEMRGLRSNVASSEVMRTTPATLALARAVRGEWIHGPRRATIVAYDSTVYLTTTRDEMRMELRRLRGDTLVADDALSAGLRVVPLGGRLVVGTDTLERARGAALPPPIPDRWKGLIGEYGWDHNILYVLEQEGKLTALIEWFFEYPLTEISENVFAFPSRGLYDGERLIFTRDASGRASKVEAASVPFMRRVIQGEDGSVYRITPLKPVAELRTAALAATPPVERGSFLPSVLTEPRSLDSTIRLDIRYATTDNFLSTPIYTEGRAFLQRPAAEAVVRAHRKLAARGYGLLIHDAYRPWWVTKIFWDGTPNDRKIFVADPSHGSRHNRGAAVDLTLFDLATGRPVEMPGGYDEMSDRSYPMYPGGTSRQRALREILREAMESEGFHVYEAEWWHFDFDDWRSYPIGNLTFDQLMPRR